MVYNTYYTVHDIFISEDFFSSSYLFQLKKIYAFFGPTSATHFSNSRTATGQGIIFE